MPEVTDHAGVSDTVSFEMNGEPLDVTILPNEQPEVKRAAERFYTVAPNGDGWGYAVLDRWDNPVEGKSGFANETEATVAARLDAAASGVGYVIETTRLEGDDNAAHA